METAAVARLLFMAVLAVTAMRAAGRATVSGIVVCGNDLNGVVDLGPQAQAPGMATPTLCRHPTARGVEVILEAR
eukprot:SM000038S14341  [mRNA]  locus=s38:365954:366430:+ [translate_table: standard]